MTREERNAARRAAYAALRAAGATRESARRHDRLTGAGLEARVKTEARNAGRRQTYAALRQAGYSAKEARKHDKAGAERTIERLTGKYLPPPAPEPPRPPSGPLGGFGGPELPPEIERPGWWEPFWQQVGDSGMTAAERGRLEDLMERRAEEGPGALSRDELDWLDELWEEYYPDEDWRDILYGFKE